VQEQEHRRLAVAKPRPTPIDHSDKGDQPLRRLRDTSVPLLHGIGGLTGVPLPSTAICGIECVLHQHQVVGSHGVLIGRIVATQARGGSPVVNFQGELRTLP
jgi:flavin reductase (DIM6/NTAB) family NADH-FMN oxidoreductase RutF